MLWFVSTHGGGQLNIVQGPMSENPESLAIRTVLFDETTFQICTFLYTQLTADTGQGSLHLVIG